MRLMKFWKSLKETFPKPVKNPTAPLYSELDLMCAYFAGVDQESKRGYNTADKGYEEAVSSRFAEVLKRIDCKKGLGYASVFKN